MNIKYCNLEEIVDGCYIPLHHSGVCIAREKKGWIKKHAPELILIDKNLTKKYINITLIHELGHWLLFKVGFTRHLIWEWLWYGCIAKFYGKNMYKSPSK